MIRLAIRCRAENAELALAQLVELAPTGIEEIRDGEIVEYAIYGPPGEVPTLPDLEVAVGDDLVEVRTTEVPDDWHERWKQFHGAVTIGAGRVDGRRLLLRPSWEPGDGNDDALEIVLDPGQAFGTGSHPTTRLCLELLLELEPGGEAVDLGCGSGVLAIAAAMLGWDPVRAYDFDPLAVEAAGVNARANGFDAVEIGAEVGVAPEVGAAEAAVVPEVTHHLSDPNVEAGVAPGITIARADLRDRLPELAQTVFANLMRPLLLTVAGHVSATGVGAPVGPGSLRNLILSGLLDEEADEIATAYAALGLTESARVSEGGWTGLLFRR